MTKTRPVVTLVATWVTGIILIVSSVCLGWYYFTFDAKNFEVIKAAKSNFYDNLQVSWMEPSVDDMLSQLRGGPSDPFDLMILRAALGRLRVSGKAPSAYNRLLADFESGVWDGSFTKKLTPALQAIDERWVEARIAGTKRARKDIIPHVEQVPGQGFSLQFPPGTTTSDVGSQIEVSFAVAPDATPQNVVYAFWDIAQDPSIKEYRCRLCPMEDTGKTSGSFSIFRLTMDMSDSPQWLYPHTKPTWIHFRADGLVQWMPRSYGFGDSPSLPIKTDD